METIIVSVSEDGQWSEELSVSQLETYLYTIRCSSLPSCAHKHFFFCYFSTPKILSSFHLFQFSKRSFLFPLFFLTFPALLFSFIITQFYHAKERKWNGLAQNPLTVWKTTPLWSFGSRMCRISELRSRSSAPLLPEYSVIKWEETNQTGWLLVPIIKAAKIANQLS